MNTGFSRRNFFRLTTAALPLPLLAAPGGKSTVSLVKGDDRRKNATAALTAIDDKIKPLLKGRKSVVLKPNLVSTTNQLAATHADTLRGILDYLAPRFKGPVFIAESSAGNTWNGYENFGYQAVAKEHRQQKVELVDLNSEALFEVMHILNGDLHPAPIRLAKRLMDPDAFIICPAMLKTHNVVVATLSIKNMTLGAPLRSAPNVRPNWNDKRVFHGGIRQCHYDMMLAMRQMMGNWGVALIDGYEGMEGNGPSMGRPVPSRVAIASTDFLAADRIGVEAMGIDPSWPAYLNYCGQTGLGNYDLAQIDLRGETLDAVRRKYDLHRDIEIMLQWRGPLTEVPPKLG